ncbi:hypothetical protein GCM10027051_22210 [Niabella terrae]
MTKFIVLIGGILTCSACTGQVQPVTETPQAKLYPYRNQAGQFGYVDDKLQIRIEPQYKMAGLFTGQGFAVVTNHSDENLVIDKVNQVILEPDYDLVQLYELENFTLAQVSKTYYSRWRFWEWKFLPGFNLTGAGNDNRLFDTRVKRLRKTVLVLGNTPRRLFSRKSTDRGYMNKHFNVRMLDSNLVLIEDRLYAIGEKGGRFIVSGIKDPLTKNTFTQRKNRQLRIIDRTGKKINKGTYKVIDSLLFNLGEQRVMIGLSRDYAPIAKAYADEEGQVFIYPDFSKPLPRRIQENKLPGDPGAAMLIAGLWSLVPIPESDYFLVMSYQAEAFLFRFLDSQGNWYKVLPPGIRFTVTAPSGDILWPEKNQLIPLNEIPEGWKIESIHQLGEGFRYHVRLKMDKSEQQGIWDFEKKQWQIGPAYYQVLPMDNISLWRYQPDYGGLWGIMDSGGNPLIKPMYSSVAPDGWVTQAENGTIISFYLHPTTLEELREE